MKMRVPAAIILSALAVWPQTPPEVSQEDTPITFGSRVILVSVPVVVRDRAGRAVGNLRKEDFQLFDKGKLQVITKFSIEQNTEQRAKRQKSGVPTTAPGGSPKSGALLRP